MEASLTKRETREGVGYRRKKEEGDNILLIIPFLYFTLLFIYLGILEEVTFNMQMI